MKVIAPDEYLTEAEVLDRWPMLSKSEIRKARRANPPLIEFYAFHKRGGGPRCTPAQVQQYIDRVYLRGAACQSQPSDSRSETITSINPTPSGAETGTPAGMTPELAQRAAEALARRISSKPRLRSPRSSPKPRSKPGKARLALVKS